MRVKILDFILLIVVEYFLNLYFILNFLPNLLFLIFEYCKRSKEAKKELILKYKICGDFQ